MKTLYAWALPALFGGSPVDHTWVTDFDPRIKSYPTINDVIAASANNWFCWGSYHQKGGTPQYADGFLGSIAADFSLATCLVTSNLPSSGNPPAQGTIFHYGVDGVCHQLANQVLWSSNGASGGPLTVSLARGYHVSTFLFGTYGLQHSAWQTKSLGCSTGIGNLIVRGTLSQSMDATDSDDFEQQASALLIQPEAAERLQRLLELRRTAVRTSEAMRSRMSTEMFAPSGDELNAHYNNVLRQAATLLKPEEYRALFGFEPGEVVNLVDPAMVPNGGDRGS
jgi:hypothetical protein